MSINTQFTQKFTDQITDARFKVVSEMAARGFRVDLVDMEHYRIDGQLILRVTYARTISGNLIYQDGVWYYKRRITLDNTRHPVVNLDHAVLCLVDDLLVTACKCKLPLLQVSNTL